jgi:hypothetical protein
MWIFLDAGWNARCGDENYAMRAPEVGSKLADSTPTPRGPTFCIPSFAISTFIPSELRYFGKKTENLPVSDWNTRVTRIGFDIVCSLHRLHLQMGPKDPFA